MHEDLVPIGTVTDEHGGLITVLSHVEHDHCEHVALQPELPDTDGYTAEPVSVPVDQIQELRRLLFHAHAAYVPPQSTA